MVKISFLFILTIQIVQIFGQDDGLKLNIAYNSDYDFNSYNKHGYSFYDDSISDYFIEGLVLNIFNEPVDSVKILARISDFKDSSYCNYDGLFKIYLPDDKKLSRKKISLEFHKNDYNYFDTAFIYLPVKGPSSIKVKLFPKFKILLKGRIYIGNVPLEDVNVTISYDDDIYNLRTLGCYYDDENYWNCLYQGMFKSEIVAENPEDTILIGFSKLGYKSQEHKLKFADYTGELVKYRLKYADTVPNLTDNNLGLKISWPIGPESGWFLGLSYYRLLNIRNFKRIAAGLDVSVVTSNQSIDHETLPGIEVPFDSTYINGFAGPSILLYLTKPDIRRFSTYVGCTFAFSFNSGEFTYQPIAGTRFFLDMNKSFSFDVRYIAYHLDVKRFNFNYLGQAESYFSNKLDERILLNLGLQICF